MTRLLLLVCAFAVLIAGPVSARPACYVNTSAHLITISHGCRARHVIVPRGTRVDYR